MNPIGETVTVSDPTQPLPYPGTATGPDDKAKQAWEAAEVQRVALWTSDPEESGGEGEDEEEDKQSEIDRHNDALFIEKANAVVDHVVKDKDIFKPGPGMLKRGLTTLIASPLKAVSALKSAAQSAVPSVFGKASEQVESKQEDPEWKLEEKKYIRAFLTGMVKEDGTGEAWPCDQDGRPQYQDFIDLFDIVFDVAGKHEALARLSRLYKANQVRAIIEGFNALVLPKPDKRATKADKKAGSTPSQEIKGDHNDVWGIAHFITAVMAASPVDYDALDHKEVARHLRFCIRDGRAYAQRNTTLKVGEVNVFEIWSKTLETMMPKPTEAKEKESLVRHGGMYLAAFGMGLFGQLDEKAEEGDWQANTGKALLANKARWDASMDSFGAHVEAKEVANQVKAALPLMIKNTRWLLQGVDMGDD
jgi:hypothetical protein